MLYINEYFYTIGGNFWSKGNNDQRIARLNAKTLQWNTEYEGFGKLVNGRQGHNAIFNGDHIIVVGGNTTPTERCKISSTKVTCQIQAPSLTDYYGFPALFLVPSYYCKP